MWNRGAGHAINRDVARLSDNHAGFFKPHIRGVRDRTHGNQAVGSLNRGAIGKLDRDLVTVTGHRIGANLGTDLNAVLLENVLKQAGRVLVLTRKNTVTRGHEGHPRTQQVVCGRELGTRDTRTDHDQMLRALLHPIDLLPGHDALTVRNSGRQLTRVRTHRDDHIIGIEAGGRTVLARHLNRVRAHQTATALDHLNTRLNQASPDVRRLLGSQRKQTFIDVAEIRIDLMLIRTADRQLARDRNPTHSVSGTNQSLRGHNIGQNSRTTHPLIFNQGHLRTQLCTDHRGLITTGAATNNDKTWRVKINLSAHSLHCVISGTRSLNPVQAGLRTMRLSPRSGDVAAGAAQT